MFNDTQVVKARLFGNKASGGRLELLVERVLEDGRVVAHMKVSKKPPAGATLAMDGGFAATLLGRWPDADGPLGPQLWAIGGFMLFVLLIGLKRYRRTLD